jgi:hypothetical protein
MLVGQTKFPKKNIHAHCMVPIQNLPDIIYNPKQAEVGEYNPKQVVRSRRVQSKTSRKK